MTTERTWIIRDHLPDGSWGPEREVTVEQYREEIAAKSRRAVEIFRSNAEAAHVALASGGSS